MDRNYDSSRTCRKCLSLCVWKTWLILVTLLCTVGGFVVFVASILVMTDESFAEDIQTDENLHGIRTGAAVLLVAGLFVISINVVGLVGTFFRLPKVLLAYFIMVLIFLLLPELALILWLLTRQEDVVQLIDEVISRNLVDFVKDNEVHARTFMVNVQSTLHCCGLMGIGDYIEGDQRDTCLKEDKTYYITGCKHALGKMFMENIFIVSGVEIFHLVILTIGMVAAWKVRKKILDAKNIPRDRNTSYHLADIKTEEDEHLAMDEMSTQTVTSTCYIE